MNILIMKHSKYQIRYEEGKEHAYRIYRCDKDVTDEMKNNLVSDLFYEILTQKETIERLTKEKHDAEHQNLVSSLKDFKKPERND